LSFTRCLFIFLDILSILLSLASQTVTFSSFIQPRAERS
jgi:hypothetical protein